MAKLDEIVAYANQILEVDKYQDYCPNGLQIEGAVDVQKIICGVTASQYLIDHAVNNNADMLLVHHGYFWRGESLPLVGIKKARIKSLLDANINLVAYHLPLDGHRQLGNNAQLANKLDIVVEDWFGHSAPEICLIGSLSEKTSAQLFAEHIKHKLSRQPVHLSKNKNRLIQRIAICSGSAQNYFEMAIAKGADAFITGEVSEQNYHLAMETGIDFYAAGHHATERYGVQALAKIIAEKFNVKTDYIEIENPV